MKPKAIITVLLLLFVAVSIVLIVLKEGNRQDILIAQDSAGSVELPATANSNSSATPDHPDISNAASPLGGGENEPALSFDDFVAGQAVSACGVPWQSVTAFYFHDKVRCSNCIKIETWTKAALESSFEDDMAMRKLKWVMIDTSEPEYEHFIQDYQLHTKQVVLVERHGDEEIRWKDLSRVWELLGNEDKFQEYIAEEVTAFMADVPWDAGWETASGGVSK